MKIRTWYNTTLDKYFTDYSQPILDYKVGYINGQGHILIACVYFHKDKVFYTSEAAERYFYKRVHGFKYRVKKKLIDFIKKL